MNARGEEVNIAQEGFHQRRPSPRQEFSWKEQGLEHARRQAYREAQSDVVREVNLWIPSENWGMVVLSGDKHIGSPGFDWAKFQYDSELVINTPDVYELDMGDIIDNLFFHADEEIFNVEEQVNFVNSWAKAMLDAGKMLTTIGGNHTEWMSKIGVPFWMLISGMNGLVPYMRDGGFLNLKYGEVVYKFRLDHKTKYNSDLNPHHTNHRTFWMNASHADIIASAHTHSNSVEQWNLRDEHDEPRTVTFVKTGSMKKRDPYKDQNGFIPDWQTGSPCVLLNPKKKEVLTAPNVQAGVNLLERLNRR